MPFMLQNTEYLGYMIGITTAHLSSTSESADCELRETESRGQRKKKFVLSLVREPKASFHKATLT